jgi:hypothetical protein
MMPKPDATAIGRAQVAAGKYLEQGLSDLGAGISSLAGGSGGGGLGSSSPGQKHEQNIRAEDYIWQQSLALDEKMRMMEPGQAEGLANQFKADFTNSTRQYMMGVPDDLKAGIDSKMFSTMRNLHGIALQYERDHMSAFAAGNIDDWISQRGTARAARAGGVSSYDQLMEVSADYRRQLESVPNSWMPPMQKEAARRAGMQKLGLSYLSTASPSHVQNLTRRGTSPMTAAAWLSSHDVEGFRNVAYFDRNESGGGGAWRVGYGSDTITRADGSVVKVKQGMTVSQADAWRDLNRRLNGPVYDTVINAIGGDAYGNLNYVTQEMLKALTYNYGHLPKSVAAAARTGDVAAVGRAIQNLPADVNKRRRWREGSIVLESVNMFEAPTEWRNVSVTTATHGKIRDKPIQKQVDYWARAGAAMTAQATGLNIGLVYTSGGQPSYGPDRTGSHRHDWGGAVDLVLTVDGKQVTPLERPDLYATFLKYSVAAGATGVGHYPMHVHVGGGSAVAWGPNGSSSTLHPKYQRAIQEGRAMAAAGGGAMGGAGLPEPLAVLSHDDWAKWRSDNAGALQAQQEQDIVRVITETVGDNQGMAFEWANNIPMDPETRDGVVQRLDKHYKQKETIRKGNADAEFRAAYEGIMEVINAGSYDQQGNRFFDTNATMAIYRQVEGNPDISKEELGRLLDLAQNGPARISDNVVLGQWRDTMNAAEAGDEVARKQVLEADFSQLSTYLTDGDITTLEEDRDKLKTYIETEERRIRGYVKDMQSEGAPLLKSYFRTWAPEGTDKEKDIDEWLAKPEVVARLRFVEEMWLKHLEGAIRLREKAGKPGPIYGSDLRREMSLFFRNIAKDTHTGERVDPEDVVAIYEQDFTENFKRYDEEASAATGEDVWVDINAEDAHNILRFVYREIGQQSLDMQTPQMVRDWLVRAKELHDDPKTRGTKKDFLAQMGIHRSGADGKLLPQDPLRILFDLSDPTPSLETYSVEELYPSGSGEQTMREEAYPGWMEERLLGEGQITDMLREDSVAPSPRNMRKMAQESLRQLNADILETYGIDINEALTGAVRAIQDMRFEEEADFKAENYPRHPYYDAMEDAEANLPARPAEQETSWDFNIVSSAAAATLPGEPVVGGVSEDIDREEQNELGLMLKDWTRFDETTNWAEPINSMVKELIDAIRNNEVTLEEAEAMSDNIRNTIQNPQKTIGGSIVDRAIENKRQDEAMDTVSERVKTKKLSKEQLISHIQWWIDQRAGPSGFNDSPGALALRAIIQDLRRNKITVEQARKEAENYMVRLPDMQPNVSGEVDKQALELSMGERHSKTGRPILRNEDGSVSTEESITVTDPRLNNGRPTNIPSIWGGKRLGEDAAVTEALRSGRKFKAYKSIDEAVQAAQRRSRMLGATQ